MCLHHAKCIYHLRSFGKVLSCTGNTLLKSSDKLCKHIHEVLHRRLVCSKYVVKYITNPQQVLKLYSVTLKCLQFMFQKYLGYEYFKY